MKLGIIGSGRIAKRAVAELQYVPELQITAVYNPSTLHGEEFARWIESVFAGGVELGNSKCSGATVDRMAVQAALDLEELAELVDAVYIASPHGTHFEYARQMLELGRHVICEKPMCFKAQQVKALYELAALKSVVLMEAVKTAYCPGFKKIEEVVRSGTIGEVADMEATFTRLTKPGCREFDDVIWGGAFTEFGSYVMLPIFRFLGARSYQVEIKSIPATTGVDGYTRAEFTFHGAKELGDQGNRVSSESESLLGFASARTGLTVKSEGQLVISGTNGYILVPSPWWLTRYFEVRFEDHMRVDRYDCEFEGDGLRYEFQEFVKRAKENVEEDRVLFSLEESEVLARAEVYEKFLARRLNAK